MKIYSVDLQLRMKEVEDISIKREDVNTTMYNIFKTMYGFPSRELSVIVGFDALGITYVSQVGIGTSHSVKANNKEIFKTLLLSNAERFVFIHNHPYTTSMDTLKFSRGDLKATKSLILASNVLDIPLKDSLVVCPSGFKSMKDEHPQIFKILSY